MILYYSGTGNSRYAAAKLAEFLEDATLDLTPYFRAEKNGRKPASGEFQSEKPYVIVCPTYCWKLPKLVEAFLRSSIFAGNRDIYFVLTCGSGTGNADIHAEVLCSELGLHFMGLAPVIMPENYIAMFDSPDYDEALRLIYAANHQLETLANYILYSKPFLPVEHSSTDKLLTAINPYFYKFFVTDRKFRATTACVGCHKCANVCPKANIVLQNSKPTWHGDCTQCMACISICPVNAIEYGSKTKNKRRYYLHQDGTQKR